MEDAQPKPAQQAGCLHLLKMGLAVSVALYLLRGSAGDKPVPPEFVRYGVAIGFAIVALVALTLLTNAFTKRLKGAPTGSQAAPNLGGIFAADLLLSVAIACLLGALGRALLG